MDNILDERVKMVEGKLDRIAGEIKDTNARIKELYVDLSRLLESLQ